MAHMTVRATYALDEQTSQHIKRLAKTWRVSQAEVIRRSVRTAAEREGKTLTPAEVVGRYAKGSLPRNKAQTRQVIRSLRALRHADDRHHAVPSVP